MSLQVLTPGKFLCTTIETEYKADHLWVTDVSHMVLNYQEKKKPRIAEYKMMKQITITANAFSVGHGLLLHVGARWCRDPSLRYYIYLIRDGHTFKYAVEFAYG